MRGFYFSRDRRNIFFFFEFRSYRFLKLLFFDVGRCVCFVFNQGGSQGERRLVEKLERVFVVFFSSGIRVQFCFQIWQCFSSLRIRFGVLEIVRFKKGEKGKVFYFWGEQGMDGGFYSRGRCWVGRLDDGVGLSRESLGDLGLSGMNILIFVY